MSTIRVASQSQQQSHDRNPALAIARIRNPLHLLRALLFDDDDDDGDNDGRWQIDDADDASDVADSIACRRLTVLFAGEGDRVRERGLGRLDLDDFEEVSQRSATRRRRLSLSAVRLRPCGLPLVALALDSLPSRESLSPKFSRRRLSFRAPTAVPQCDAAPEVDHVQRRAQKNFWRREAST